MKHCPYCAEEIQEAAIKCKHCGEFLDGTPRGKVGQARAPADKWYFRTIFLILILASIGPFGLPLLWWHPTLNRRWKIALTLAVLLLTSLSIFVTIEAVKMLNDSYSELMRTMNGY